MVDARVYIRCWKMMETHQDSNRHTGSNPVLGYARCMKEVEMPPSSLGC